MVKCLGNGGKSKLRVPQHKKKIKEEHDRSASIRKVMPQFTYFKKAPKNNDLFLAGLFFYIKRPDGRTAEPFRSGELRYSAASFRPALKMGLKRL